MELKNKKKVFSQKPPLTPLEPSTSGQAVVEYVLILFLSFMVFTLVAKWFATSGMMEKISAPAKNQYKTLYKYGFSKAKGKEEGGAELHPSPYAGNESRIFVNPSQ